MSEPDENTTRVKRETELQAPPEEVWDSLTDERRLAEWLADEVELDPVEGGDLRIRTDGEERTGTVETVEEEHRLAFLWRGRDEVETRVEFTLEPSDVGTRLIVIETTAIGGPSASAINLAWHGRLITLRAAVVRAPVA